MMVTVAGKQVDVAAFLERVAREDEEAAALLVAQLMSETEEGDRNDYIGLRLFARAFRVRVTRWLTSFLSFRVNDPVYSAEDAWVELLYRVHTRIMEFDRKRASFFGWVMAQTRWAALDVVRQERKGVQLVDEAASPAVEEVAAADPAASAAERDALRRGFKRLTETERLLLYLRYVLDFRNVEIARETDVELPEEHVRVYVGRAAARLKSLYLEELAPRLGR